MEVGGVVKCKDFCLPPYQHSLPWDLRIMAADRYQSMAC